MASAADVAQAATQLAALTRRMDAIEAFVQSNRLPDATGTGERNLAKAIMDLEIPVNALMQDKPLQQSNVEAIVADRMKAGVEAIIDSKLRTAMQFVKTPQQSDTTGWNRSILESKAIQDLSAVVDSKQYRQWNKKAKNALDQIRPHSRRMLDAVEKITEDEINDAIQLRGYTTRCDAITNLVSQKHNNQDVTNLMSTLNTDLWAILCAKAEGEAEEKLESCTQGEGLWAYVRIHSWFTRTTDQGRSKRLAAIMNPSRCVHEHEISAAVERWEEKYRALREDDRTMELPDVWKITALRMMLCGEIQKSVEYREKEFKTYDELRSVVMKWAINRKIENERAGHDPMDLQSSPIF